MENTLSDQTTIPKAKMEQKDLHQSAPRHLKEAFKLYKQTTYTATGEPPSPADITTLGSISTEAQTIAFEAFMKAAPKFEPTSSTPSPDLEPPLSESQLEGSSYGSEVIPGRKI